MVTAGEEQFEKDWPSRANWMGDLTPARESGSRVALWGGREAQGPPDPAMLPLCFVLVAQACCPGPVCDFLPAAREPQDGAHSHSRPELGWGLLTQRPYLRQGALLLCVCGVPSIPFLGFQYLIAGSSHTSASPVV